MGLAHARRNNQLAVPNSYVGPTCHSCYKVGRYDCSSVFLLANERTNELSHDKHDPADQGSR